TSQVWQIFLFAGLLPGLGFAGASNVPATALLAQWFERRLGLATGIMSSAIPAGQSLFVPLAALLIPLLGWRTTYVGLGLLLAVVALPVLAVLAREPRRPTAPPASRAEAPASAGTDVWLVGGGYFACGFTDQFVALHLVVLATDAGIDPLLA